MKHAPPEVCARSKCCTVACRRAEASKELTAVLNGLKKMMQYHCKALDDKYVRTSLKTRLTDYLSKRFEGLKLFDCLSCGLVPYVYEVVFKKSVQSCCICSPQHEVKGSVAPYALLAVAALAGVKLVQLSVVLPTALLFLFVLLNRPIFGKYMELGIKAAEDIIRGKKRGLIKFKLYAYVIFVVASMLFASAATLVAESLYVYLSALFSGIAYGPERGAPKPMFAHPLDSALSDVQLIGQAYKYVSLFVFLINLLTFIPIAPAYEIADCAATDERVAALLAIAFIVLERFHLLP